MRMKLRGKILSGFLLLALMLLVAGAWSIYQLRSIGASVQRLLDDNYRSINAAEAMVETLEREDSAVLLLMLGRWEEGRDLLSSADGAFEETFAVASGNVTVPGEREHVDRIRASYDRYQALWERPIVDTGREGNLPWYFAEVHSAFLDAKDDVDALKRINEESLYATASNLKDRAGRAVLPGVVATISALIFSFLFAYLTNRFMVSPIVRITRGVEGFVSGGRPFDVDVETGDEIESLAESVRKVCSREGGSGGR
jgi:hypothetical protein